MASRRLFLSSPWRAVSSTSLRPASGFNTPCLNSAAALRYSSNSSSTSAIAYKALRRRQAPLPVSDAPSAWSAQAAVSNILYETPTPSMAPSTRHILNCLVQNEPGVLSRVSGILAARGFNIDSLVVCSTEVEDLSRMTIVLTGQDGVVEQARRQLEDLVPVWAVLDYTNAALVQRELLLAKVNILGPEYFEELLAHHREITAPFGSGGEQESEVADVTLAEVSEDFHPSRLAASEALRHKHEHLKSITYFTHQFGGKVLDISTNSCIVEVSAKPSRIDSFLKLVGPFGILESARTGLMALPRSPLHGPDEVTPTKEADEVVDASQLPPG
ncbi:MAG: acetolactate synthase, regulatory subunit [Sporothrix epigloea]